MGFKPRKQKCSNKILQRYFGCLQQFCRATEASSIVCTGDSHVGKSLSETVTVHAAENERSRKIAVRKGELPILVLGAAITLITSCTIKQLASTTTEHSEPLFNLLLKLWFKVRQQMLLPSIYLYKGGNACLSDLSVNDVAEGICRLSIYCQHQASLPNQDIEKIWFGLHWSTFKNFIIEHWENSPFLIIKAFQPFVQDDVIGLLGLCPFPGCDAAILFLHSFMYGFLPAYFFR